MSVGANEMMGQLLQQQLLKRAMGSGGGGGLGSIGSSGDNGDEREPAIMKAMEATPIGGPIVTAERAVTNAALSPIAKPMEIASKAMKGMGSGLSGASSMMASPEAGMAKMLREQLQGMMASKIGQGMPEPANQAQSANTVPSSMNPPPQGRMDVPPGAPAARGVQDSGPPQQGSQPMAKPAPQPQTGDVMEDARKKAMMQDMMRGGGA